MKTIAEKRKHLPAPGLLRPLAHFFFTAQQRIKNIGVTPALGNYDKRKLGIFNQLNFLQLVTGIGIPLAGLLPYNSLPLSLVAIACLPALLSALALLFNHRRQYQLSLLTYFILYPFFTCAVYINSMNLGVELNFVLYGILAVFFLQDFGYMMFTIAMSMMSYFLLSVVLTHFTYQLQNINYPLYLVNEAIAIVFIFYGLILIKHENTSYQQHILHKNKTLRVKNGEIRKAKTELAHKATQLQKRRAELAELNGVKDKLFSIVAHDLRAPLYGLRHLFSSMQQTCLPAEEIKTRLPHVLNDVNYTISLMENLLHWSKSQMHASVVYPTNLQLDALIGETVRLLHQQALAKNIFVENAATGMHQAVADKEMISLVLRNLLSNAIKFTPAGGYVEVGIRETAGALRVYVQDSGAGLSPEVLKKIDADHFYTTTGTAYESGTGLGLKLCREFLAKNNSFLQIKSSSEGSTFFFEMPQA